MDLHPSKRRKLNGLVLDDSQRGSDTSTSTSSSAERPASQSINRNPSKSDQSCGPSPAFQYGARRGQTIYQQSTFSELQIRELLNGLRPKHEQRMVRVEKVMQRLKNIIDGIPRREGLPAHEAQRILEQSSNVRIPFAISDPRAASDTILAYSKPVKIDLVGCYARKTTILLGGRTTVDMAVTMPSDLFHDKDYCDYRYYYKRAYYLACLAAGLENANALDLELSFTYQDDNRLQPIIVVRSSQDENRSDLAQAICDCLRTASVVSKPDSQSSLMGLEFIDKPSISATAQELQLKHEATSSLRALGNPVVDSFKSLFISKVYEPYKMYDFLFRISSNKGTTTVPSRENDIGPLASLADDLYEKFSYGLGNRAILIHPMVPNQDHCRRIVDRGPSIDDKTASAHFRHFWGDKAELRRFKDGTIVESLIWDDSDPERSVIGQITKHIVHRQYGQRGQADHPNSDKAFDTLLPWQSATQQDVLRQFSTVTNAFESLCQILRAMDGLPLQIRTLSPASPELRFSSLVAPVAGNPNRLGQPIEFYVQFEYSTRWPDDLAAIQRTKIAFLLTIASRLEKDTSVSTVRLGLDSSKSKLLEHSFLDIVTTHNIVFRLRIHHEHEFEILGQFLNGQRRFLGSKEEVALAVTEFKRTYTHGPAHTQAVATLITRYPMLSLTIRLLKRWRDCHLLSSQIRDELIELLALRSFVCPYPWATPGSLRSAFLRTLAFVASWDWQSEPLIVDFKSDLTKQEIDGIHLRFEAWRRLDPSMNRVAMFAASNIDREGITWTENRLARIMATRFTNLAKASINHANVQGLELNPEALFMPSLAGYDFVIHLKHRTSAADRKGFPFKNLQLSRDSNAIDAMLGPTRHFFNELQWLYGENVIFFQNESAPTVIAGLWNPQTGPRNWKINLHYSTVPWRKRGDAEPQITINRTSILNDIARIGINVITRIDEEVSKRTSKCQP
ncbi:hypothetical protein Q9189_000959 [Teloschistes chrysophthalmus]